MENEIFNLRLNQGFSHISGNNACLICLIQAEYVFNNRDFGSRRVETAKSRPVVYY